MSATTFRFSRFIGFTTVLVLAPTVAAIAAMPPQKNVARFSVGARLDDKIAEAALISGQPTIGYVLSDGQTDFVLALSKIENIDAVSFVNNGATGSVTISASNSKLAAASMQWQQIAKQDLTANVTRIKIGPTEAKYLKFTFTVAKSGRIADLGVYQTPGLTIANATLAGGSQGSVDPKDAKDVKDFKESKEVAEAPAEGPPPNLPDPPPFVFTPIRPLLVPVSE